MLQLLINVNSKELEDLKTVWLSRFVCKVFPQEGLPEECHQERN